MVTKIQAIVPYYGLVSSDLHILELWWRLPLCSLIFVEITPVLWHIQEAATPHTSILHSFHASAHYFYVPWLIMTSQWVTMLLGMAHCCITMGKDIARDIHCDITMGNDIAMCTYRGITMDNDIAMKLFCYVLLQQIMILLFHQ